MRIAANRRLARHLDAGAVLRLNFSWETILDLQEKLRWMLMAEVFTCEVLKERLSGFSVPDHL